MRPRRGTWQSAQARGTQGGELLRRFTQNETDEDRSKKRLASMVVDVSRGIVQDFMIGLQSDAASRDREEL